MKKVRKTSENNRKFRGVWIPAKYWLDENLTINEVALLTEIDSLDGEKGCFASNAHFANFLGVTPGRASQLVKGLKDKGYIKVSYSTVNNVTQRSIRVLNKLNTGVFRKLKGGIKNSKGVFRKCGTSNTSSNTYKSNTLSSSNPPKDPFDLTADSKEEEDEKIKEIIKDFESQAFYVLSDVEKRRITKLAHKMSLNDFNDVVNEVIKARNSHDLVFDPAAYLIKSLQNAR